VSAHRGLSPGAPLSDARNPKDCVDLLATRGASSEDGASKEGFSGPKTSSASLSSRSPPWVSSSLPFFDRSEERSSIGSGFDAPRTSSSGHREGFEAPRSSSAHPRPVSHARASPSDEMLSESRSEERFLLSSPPAELFQEPWTTPRNFESPRTPSVSLNHRRSWQAHWSNSHLASLDPKAHFCFLKTQLRACKRLVSKSPSLGFPSLWRVQAKSATHVEIA
jgi:hypothetical protein